MRYDGAPIAGELVRLVAPGADFDAALARSELTASERPWAAVAGADERALVFAIEATGAVIGDCGLHDIVPEKGEAMLGYHLFLAENRGCGYGGDAVRTLVGFARDGLGLRRLVAITGVENAASQRTALSAGLRSIGPAWEGPHLVVFVLEEPSGGAP